MEVLEPQNMSIDEFDVGNSETPYPGFRSFKTVTERLVFFLFQLKKSSVFASVFYCFYQYL